MMTERKGVPISPTEGIPDVFPPVTAEMLLRKRGISKTSGDERDLVSEAKYTLAMKSALRKTFFTINPFVEYLLKKNHKNPLLEEGFYDINTRAQCGEYFLTSDIVEMILQFKLRQHKTKPGGIAYNTDNIFLISRGPCQLTQILHRINLQPGQDAKFIYLNDIHGIPFYMRNEGGIIKCFIVDPTSDIELYVKPIANCLLEYYQQPMRLHFIFSSTQLQNDWYSCTTFAIAAVRYFAKHGEEIFPYLAKAQMLRLSQDKFSYLILDPNHLMPKLLKWCQNFLSIKAPAAAFAEVVSHKKQLTLQQYNFTKICSTIYDEEQGNCNKTYNIALLQKRYKWLAETNQFLLEQFHVSPAQVSLTLHQHRLLNIKKATVTRHLAQKNRLFFHTDFKKLTAFHAILAELPPVAFIIEEEKCRLLHTEIAAVENQMAEVNKLQTIHQFSHYQPTLLGHSSRVVIKKNNLNSITLSPFRPK